MGKVKILLQDNAILVRILIRLWNSEIMSACGIVRLSRRFFVLFAHVAVEI